jgi:hypothetical protein
MGVDPAIDFRRAGELPTALPTVPEPPDPDVDAPPDEQLMNAPTSGPPLIDPRRALLAQAGAWDLLVSCEAIELDDAFDQLAGGVADINGLPECNCCGGRPCVNELFCDACRAADRQRKPADDRTRFLRALLDPKVGLDAAWRALNDRRERRR